MALHTCNLKAREVETGQVLGLVASPFSQLVSSGFGDMSCLNK